MGSTVETVGLPTSLEQLTERNDDCLKRII